MTWAERINALEALGYGIREAAFLSLVAVHSGYFLRRQYETFISAPRGRPASRFLRQVLDAEHARSTEYANRTEVFHLFSRAVYRTIGEEGNRNRRPRPHCSIKAKLMALDFVLAHRDLRFLGTEDEKTSHFCGDLGIAQALLPSKTYRSSHSSRETSRYFVEKYPVFVGPIGDRARSAVTSFCYVDEGVLSTTGFTTFLKRYRRLFVALRHFRIVYVAAERRAFRNAERAFNGFAKSLANPESQRPRGAMGDYFGLRYLLKTRQYQRLDKAKLDRLRDLSHRFQHPTTDIAFREWANEVASIERLGPIDVSFEFHLLPHCYEIFWSQK